jgi:hypothetical protein
VSQAETVARADRRAWRLAMAASIVVGVVFVAGEGASFATGSVDPFGLFVFVFPLVGFIILRQQPRNRIGWILLGIGGVVVYDAVLSSYGAYGLQHPGSLPGAAAAEALTGATWAPVIGIVGTFLLLLFPDGRLPSPRWKWVAWMAGVGIVGTYVGLSVLPGKLTDAGYPHVTNPLGIEALRGHEAFVFAFIPLIPIAIVGSAASLGWRFRRSTGTVRLQLKWLTAAAAVVAVLYALAMVSGISEGWFGPDNIVLNVIQNVSVLSFFLIPIAIGFAVLRHRLYDIDVVVNKTLVYGLLTAILAAVYVALAVGVGSVAGRNNSVVIAGSTLVVAALFRPVRRRAQALIDRRFYRRKYDAQQTLESFTARLREEVDLDELHSHLLAVVEETVRPASMSLWLRETGA